MAATANVAMGPAIGTIPPQPRPEHTELSRLVSFLIDKPLAILAILSGGFVVGKVARRLVKLVVRRLGGRRLRHGPGLLRRHTPAALLDTQQLLTTRAQQRIEAMAAGLAGIAQAVTGEVVARRAPIRVGPHTACGFSAMA